MTLTREQIEELRAELLPLRPTPYADRINALCDLALSALSARAEPPLRQGMDDLAPCPFCGGVATFEQTETAPFGTVRWTVGCNEREEAILCYGYQSLTTFATKREAAKAWNRRASPSSPPLSGRVTKDEMDDQDGSDATKALAQPDGLSWDELKQKHGLESPSPILSGEVGEIRKPKTYAELVTAVKSAIWRARHDGTDEGVAAVAVFMERDHE